MTAHDKLVALAIVTNIILWGGLLLFFLIISVADPMTPEDTLKQEAIEKEADPVEETMEIVGGPPKHRA